MQALTAQAATSGRFTLGLSTGHRTVLEQTYGYSVDHPVRHTREYLSVLGPLLRRESVDFRGRTRHTTAAVAAPGASAPRVLLAALGPGAGAGDHGGLPRTCSRL